MWAISSHVCSILFLLTNWQKFVLSFYSCTAKVAIDQSAMYCFVTSKVFLFLMYLIMMQSNIPLASIL